MAVLHQSDNPNSLANNKFKFVLNRAPNVVYWCQEATIPSLSLASVKQYTPLSNIPRPGGKIEWEDYSLTFKVDEDLSNYLEMFTWMTNLGFTDDLGGYQRINATGENIVSDATLVILTSKENPNLSILFRDLYPISLSPLQFNTKDSNLNYMDAQ